ncbi:aspartate/glutamate racemase family protein [Brevibacterium aurantiacum]|uniref:Aspartate racemase n=1 Tax=Brevibacterium aurantiacum TaxID=273384 RepID=A0A2H1J2A2_BREAU|nr:amino acid racemase [Brevibacterium aurantiacum]SMX81585.1 aspartate racemase [Brevibacterium aurantiacum]
MLRKQSGSITPLVGILGGMGPAATVDLYSKLIEATPAAGDQGHLRVMIWADPTVPDRSAAIAGDGEDPTPKLAAGAQQLADAGAAFYIVACNGAHAFLPRVREQVDLDYLSIIDVTAAHVAALPYVKSAGLLATDATLTAGLYQDALLAAGVTPTVPAREDQHIVMETIYAVKAKELRPELTQALAGVTDRLSERGADVIIAACTEIPLALTADQSARPLIDPAVLLANEVINEAAARAR